MLTSSLLKMDLDGSQQNLNRYLLKFCDTKIHFKLEGVADIGVTTFSVSRSVNVFCCTHILSCKC